MSGSRKRALVVTDHGDEPPARRLRPLESIYQAHAQSELEDLKAALEHERSLRSLDQRRAQQIQTRLERQVQFAVEQAQDAKTLLEDLREESDLHVAQLREARAEALLQLRDCQTRLADAELDVAEAPNVEMVEKNQALLEEQLQNKVEEVEALRQRLMEVTEEKLLSLAEPKAEKPAEPEYQSGAFVTAPTEVLRELNKTRIELAESERKFRQLRRKSDEWHQKANQYVHEREANRSATGRLHQVEQELRELRKEHEAVRASNQSWSEFGQKLGALVMGELSANTKGGPPEIATVLRHMEKAKLRTKELVDDTATLQRSLDASNERVASLESMIKANAAALSKSIAEKKEVEGQLDSANQQLQSMRAQEGIYRREADSLRSLLKTFDEIPGSRDAQTSSTGVTVKSLEVSLAAAREEIRALTEDRGRLTKETESLSQAQKEQQKEYASIVEKFGRLREALHAEKGKVEESESRACKAEALAGKGSYNTEESRVLHLAQNPLAEAIRDRYETEIRALHRQLEEVTGQKPARGAASLGSEVDPQKLHQRLKQSFKEQIALFREGVYLMTGYKVDMLPGEKPMFRVRSVYAEQEQDHLMFLCQKSGDEVTSLDLVETDLAKLLSTTDSYQYMTKFNSLPSFLASVQLSLFEKQTFISI
jgi:hypothetical protein